jgi:uncharacterized membrane protein
MSANGCHEMNHQAGQRVTSLPGQWLVYGLILLYVVFFSWLAVVRHQTFHSSAMDLGYTDQVVWNTLHGRFMRFSTYENAPIDLPLDRFRRTDSLLAYHVELLLAPISLLYLLYESPVTLLILQVVTIALGALPAFWLARDRLKSEFGGVAFALAYLLAPALQGATLSDFHAVSLTASLLLFALYYMLARRYRPFIVIAIVAMAAKEDIPLIIAMMGLYVCLVQRQRLVGALTTILALAWLLISTQVILPYFSGLSVSPFAVRMAVFGPTVKESLTNLIAEPLLLWRWLRQPAIAGYLSGLLASAGFMSFFSPLILGLCAPVVAMNVFSTWSWSHSEGAHYSASIVPFVITSGICGLAFLARQISRRTGLGQARVTAGLTALVVVISSVHHYELGVSPPSRTFRVPRVTRHHRIAREIMAQIPADAPLSAQSGLYPHLAHREKAYLFPAINDAEYVFLDVTSSPYPISLRELKLEIEWLLMSGEFGLQDARDGYLLLRRGLSSGPSAALPDAFFSFAQATQQPIPYPTLARFADVLELIGFDYTTLNVVHASELPATVTTYWRAVETPEVNYGFAFFFTRQDGAIVGHYDGGTATSLWYPTRKWRQGEVIAMETPVLPIGRLHDVMVAVTLPLADPLSPEGRLRPVESLGGQTLEMFQDDSLVKLFSFPGT